MSERSRASRAVDLPSDDVAAVDLPSDDVVATTQATYNTIGSAYAAENRELPESVVESMNRFVAGLPPHAIVADVGCGPGRDLAALRERGVNAYGFDLSLGMLVAGRPAGGVVQADMTMLPVRRASLDGLWCAAALLHVPRELTAPTIAQFAYAVRAGGVLHLSVAEGTGEGLQAARYGAGDNLWVVHREEDELRRTLSGAGFRVTSVDRSTSHRSWLTMGAVRDGS